jgi:hypothetical protein
MSDYQLSNQWDIDIDVKSGLDRSVYGTRAMVYNEEHESLSIHPSGVYLDIVPIDKVMGICSFDHHYGDEYGFIKIDLLTNTSYDRFMSKEEVREMSEKEPNWRLLKDKKIVSRLPHISNHFDFIQSLDITSVDDLADALALIRPGKTHLIDGYLDNKKSVRRQLYLRPTNNQAFFKKAHAYSYAVMIATILNKMDLFQIR